MVALTSLYTDFSPNNLYQFFLSYYNRLFIFLFFFNGLLLPYTHSIFFFWPLFFFFFFFGPFFLTSFFMTITIKFQISKLQGKEKKTAAYWQPVRILKRTKKKSISKVQQYRNVLKYWDTQRQQTFHLFKM